MFLGVEIGGTKLQVGVGASGSAPLVALCRTTVDATQGAAGILAWVAEQGSALIAEYRPRAVGVGFGGPVDLAGRVLKSHHVQGWIDFPLADWCRATWQLPTNVGNDADVAGLAEATHGAGRGRNPVVYLTIGTGIGGGLIVDRAIYRGQGLGAAEIGHLRPGVDANSPTLHLESWASGWGLAARAQAAVRASLGPHAPDALQPWSSRAKTPFHEPATLALGAAPSDAQQLLDLAGGQLGQISARTLGHAAAAGNQLAAQVLAEAWRHLGWGLAQVITLTGPQAVVIGGGVSLLGETLLFAPLRKAVAEYVFPPFAGSYEIVPALLGEEVVVRGAVALAETAS